MAKQYPLSESIMSHFHTSCQTSLTLAIAIFSSTLEPSKPVVYINPNLTCLREAVVINCTKYQPYVRTLQSAVPISIGAWCMELFRMSPAGPCVHPSV